MQRMMSYKSYMSTHIFACPPAGTHEYPRLALGILPFQFWHCIPSVIKSYWPHMQNGCWYTIHFPSLCSYVKSVFTVGRLDQSPTCRGSGKRSEGRLRNDLPSCYLYEPFPKAASPCRNGLYILFTSVHSCFFPYIGLLCFLDYVSGLVLEVASDFLLCP